MNFQNYSTRADINHQDGPAELRLNQQLPESRFLPGLSMRQAPGGCGPLGPRDGGAPLALFQGWGQCPCERKCLWWRIPCFLNPSAPNLVVKFRWFCKIFVSWVEKSGKWKAWDQSWWRQTSFREKAASRSVGGQSSYPREYLVTVTHTLEVQDSAEAPFPSCSLKGEENNVKLGH